MDSGPVAAAAWAPINTTDSTNAPHHHAAAQAALGGGMPSSQRRVLLLSFERGGGGGGSHLVALHFVDKPPSLVREGNELMGVYACVYVYLCVL